LNYIKNDSVDNINLENIQHIIERFESKINKDSLCWIWKGNYFRYGYGYLNVAGKNISANRISWMLHNEKTPGKYFVCHKCDNPQCVNPDHLYLGSPQDNSDDMKKRNRSLRGELCPASKLSNDDVEQIKKRHKNGEYQRLLAKEFGVTREHLNKIINGKKRAYGI